MAKRAKKTTVFLIFDRKDQRQKLSADLQAAGYDVHDYLTAREFLIGKRTQPCGVVVADYRLQGTNGLELAKLLTKERSDFPAVLLAGNADVPKVLPVDMAELVVRPVAIESLKAAITRATDGEVFKMDNWTPYACLWPASGRVSGVRAIWLSSEVKYWHPGDINQLLEQRGEDERANI